MPAGDKRGAKLFNPPIPPIHIEFHVFLSPSYVSSYPCYVSFWQHIHTYARMHIHTRIFHPVSSSFFGFYSSDNGMRFGDSRSSSFTFCYLVRWKRTSGFPLLLLCFRSFGRWTFLPFPGCVSCLCASTRLDTIASHCGCSSEICSYIAYYVSDSYSVNNMNQTRVRICVSSSLYGCVHVIAKIVLFGKSNSRFTQVAYFFIITTISALKITTT